LSLSQFSDEGQFDRIPRRRSSRFVLTSVEDSLTAEDSLILSDDSSICQVLQVLLPCLGLGRVICLEEGRKCCKRLPGLILVQWTGGDLAGYSHQTVEILLQFPLSLTGHRLSPASEQLPAGEGEGLDRNTVPLYKLTMQVSELSVSSEHSPASIGVPPSLHSWRFHPDLILHIQSLTTAHSVIPRN